MALELPKTIQDIKDVKQEVVTFKEDMTQEINVIKSQINVTKLKTDLGEHPGSWYLAKGDITNGFYGFIQPTEMGTFEDGKVYNGVNLALAIGLSSGTAFNSDVPLMKFSRNGKVLFVPLTGYRHSVPWDEIYKRGAVYATNDDGFLPPMGRSGNQLSIVEGNKIQSTAADFLGDKSAEQDYADTVGAVGEELILKGWTTEANNIEVTITEITTNSITVSETLTPEIGSKKSRFYNKKNVVKQDSVVTIGGKQYRVRLIKGAGDNPTDSYANSDRGSTGIGNEWNDLILPLHEHAKVGDWIYPAYAKNATGGAIVDWGVGLTDENLRTHNTYGAGSYTWSQETQNLTTYRRVTRGYSGASSLSSRFSWYVNSYVCWRPVLESL